MSGGVGKYTLELERPGLGRDWRKHGGGLGQGQGS